MIFVESVCVYLSFFPVVFPNSQRTVPFHPGPFSVFRTLRWEVRVKAAFKTRVSRRWSTMCALNFASAPRNLHLVAQVLPNLKINFEPCLGLSGPMKQTRFSSCYYSWACRQSLFCLRLHSDEAYGSIQWKMTHKPRLHVKTADNCNNSRWWSERDLNSGISSPGPKLPGHAASCCLEIRVVILWALKSLTTISANQRSSTRAFSCT